jgi:hypothetical protein
VIQQWPWDNGLPLQHGNTEQRLVATLPQSGLDPTLIAMVLVCLHPYELWSKFHLLLSELCT